MDTGGTPLTWTASRGHLEVMGMLLNRGDINPEQPNNHGLTPLWCAVGNGYEGVVKVLLGCDINPNTRALGGLAPLR